MTVNEFLDFMPDTVVLEPRTGQDAFGAPTYGAPVNYRARVEGRAVLVRNAEGEQQASMITVYVGGTPGVTPSDRLTLPAGWAPQQPDIIAVGRESDETGLHHVRIYA